MWTLLLGVAMFAQAAIPAIERQALTAIYNSTNGDGWTNNSGWKTPPLDADGFAMPGTESGWHGLTVDSGTLRVTGIDLTGNNLVGTIPAEIGNLTALQNLYFDNCHLTGTIPASIGNLTRLYHLGLSNNQLSGSIPTELGNLADLGYLYLNTNQLSGSIPAELGNLANLRQLFLYSNELSGSIPPELGNVIGLQWIVLRYNHLSGAIPPELGNLANLQVLRLGDNQLSGAIPPELGNLANLQSLRLAHNHLTGEIPDTLGNLTQLWEMLINSNQLTGLIPTSLENLTALTATDFGYNALHTSDEALIAFLNAKDPDWAATQTIAPTGVTATSLENAVIMVSWLPVAYTAAAGYYAVLISEAAGGPYTLAGQTANKTTTAVNVTGLTPGTRYYFVVRTVTNAHGNNANAVESDASAEASAVAWLQLSVQITGTITLGGAPLPGVVMNGLTGNPVTNALGVYSATVNVDFSGTVTPILAGYAFDPLSRTYTNLTADQAAQDFTAEVVVLKITVTSPNGGESWRIGSTHDITWTQTGLTGSVTIDLYKGGVYQKTLGTAAAAAGTFAWAISSDEIPGADCRVLVWQSGGVSDDSDADFIVAAVNKADFLGNWAGLGVYYRNSDTGSWLRIETAPASQITAGDLDGDGTDDLIGTWPGDPGLWVKYSTTRTWAKLDPVSPDWIGVGDMNGDTRDDLVGNWPGLGVYYRDSATGSWHRIETAPANQITAGDLDGDGTDDLIGIWPNDPGIWVKFSSTSTWAMLDPVSPDWIAVGDMNGDTRDDFVGSWPGLGVYDRDSKTGTWSRTETAPASQITAGDLDGDGTDDLIGIWPNDPGVWVKYSATKTWFMLDPVKPTWIGTGRMRPNESPVNTGAKIVPDATPEVKELSHQLNLMLEKFDDVSSTGPNGADFKREPETAQGSVRVMDPGWQRQMKPGPGEPGFRPRVERTRNQKINRPG